MDALARLLEMDPNETHYYCNELADVREKLIDGIARIKQENRVVDGRIKAFNRRKQELAHEPSKAIRSVKHELHASAAAQRLTAETAARGGPQAKP